MPVATAAPEPFRDPNLDTAIALVEALARIGLIPTFFGGFGTSLLVERGGVDAIDALIVFDTADVDMLLVALEFGGFQPRFSDMAEFAVQARVVATVHRATGTVVNISLGCLPFEIQVENRASTVARNGRNLKVATPEDIIIMTAVLRWQDDSTDIRRLGRAYKDLDRNRIKSWINRFSKVKRDTLGWNLVELILGRKPPFPELNEED